MRAAAQSEVVTCPTGAEDVRIAALSGLAQMETDQVLPALNKILERRDVCSIALRRQVVGLLYRPRYGEQTDLLLNVARTDPSGEVRRYAVQVLAQANTERSVAALDSIVFSSGDTELRDAALRALSQTSAPSARASLRRAAEQESMPVELRVRAVSYVGSQRRASDDTQFLTALYAKSDRPELRDAVLRSIANQRTPEATNWLLGIARDRNRDVEVRRQALSAVGQAVRANEGTSIAGIDINGLLGLYDSFAGQLEMQDRALDMIAQRPESVATDKLLQIARAEQNIELRRKAILRVGQRRDPRVRDFLLEIVNK
jgi:HEAT repeat protein